MQESFLFCDNSDYKNSVQLLQMYLAELNRDAHELMQLMLLSATSGRHDNGPTRPADEFLRHIAERLRRKSTLAGHTLANFIDQTQNRS